MASRKKHEREEKVEAAIEEVSGNRFNIPKSALHDHLAHWKNYLHWSWKTNRCPDRSRGKGNCEILLRVSSMWIWIGQDDSGVGHKDILIEGGKGERIKDGTPGKHW